MAVDHGSAELLRRLLAGENLSADERAQIERALRKNPANRPRRAALQLLEDELGRAAHFFDAQLRGESYVSSVSYASTESRTSDRRVKGSLRWLESISGEHWKENLRILRQNAETENRISVGGIAALEPKEVFLQGCLLAFQRAVGSFSRKDRAELFVNHANALKECIGLII